MLNLKRGFVMMAGRKDDVVALDFGLVDGEVDGINGVR